MWPKISTIEIPGLLQTLRSVTPSTASLLASPVWPPMKGNFG